MATAGGAMLRRWAGRRQQVKSTAADAVTDDRPTSYTKFHI